MDKAKCIVTHEQPLPEGGFKRFEAGTVYAIDGLDPEHIKAYFEHPELAPSKRIMTRDKTVHTDDQELDR